MSIEKIHRSFAPYSSEGEDDKKNQTIKITSLNDEGATMRVNRATADFSLHYKNNVFDVSDLEKTEEEKHMISMAQTAFDKLFEDMKLLPQKFKESEIHIVDENEYAEKIQDHGKEKTFGKFSFGHVYCIRGDRREFLRVLVHELAHKASYYGLAVNVGNAVYDIALRKTGLTSQGRGEKRLFEGMNEAVTELIAKDILRRICEDNNFSEEDKRYLIMEMTSYLPQVLVVTGLTNKLADNDRYLAGKLLADFFRSYFNGDYSFFKEIEKKQSGATKIMREMGTKDEDALIAAKRLSLPESEKIIRKIIGDRNIERV